MKLRSLLLALMTLLGTLGVGCNPYSLGDSIDVELDFSPLSGPSDDLHLPYVLGAHVTIAARGADDDELRRMTLETSNPLVLRIDSQARGSAECAAVSEGVAELRVLLDGEVVTSSEIVVKAPTSVDFTPHGPLLAKRPDALPFDHRLQILTGGMATLLATYYSGDVRLYGNGVLHAESLTDITLEHKTSFLFEDREWLQVTALSPGEHEISIHVGDVDLGETQILAVNDEDVDHIQILRKDESDAVHGDELTLLAQAFDASGRPIYGVDFDWDVDGLAEPGEGDLYRYTFDENDTRTLTAHFGDLHDSLDIHSSGGSVDSSNNLGCRAAPSDSLPDASWLLVAAMAGAPFVRSRRRSYARK